MPKHKLKIKNIYYHIITMSVFNMIYVYDKRKTYYAWWWFV